MTHTTLSKTDHPAAVLRAPDGLDMRVAIYHHAAHRQPGYTPRRFLDYMLGSGVCERPQLFAINGRPC